MTKLQDKIRCYTCGKPTFDIEMFKTGKLHHILECSYCGDYISIRRLQHRNIFTVEVIHCTKLYDFKVIGNQIQLQYIED